MNDRAVGKDKRGRDNKRERKRKTERQNDKEKKAENGSKHVPYKRKKTELGERQTQKSMNEEQKKRMKHE